MINTVTREKCISGQEEAKVKESIFKEERGFFMLSENNYLYFSDNKVFLVQAQDLTTPRK